MKWIIALLWFPCITWGQVKHPRIWLDAATLTRLTALKNANDVTWIALKADADNYAGLSIPAYDRISCSANSICYSYQGEGWLDAMEPLALAYQMTGDPKYSNQVIALLTVMVNAGIAPESADSGYASRTVGLALALGYDWCYFQLGSALKTNLNRLLDTYWTYVQARGYQWNCSDSCPTGYGNYFNGHLLGMGLSAIAMEGDDSTATAIESTVLQNFNTYSVPTFSSRGGAQGGYPIEGYNYGGTSFVRLFQYMQAMKTAGKTDLFTAYFSWLRAVAQNTIYEVRPDLWAITDEGEWPGVVTRVLYPAFVYDIGGMLNGTDEGGWLRYLYGHLNAPPDSVVMTPYNPSNFEKFLYNTGTLSVDYTATLPSYNFSPGDEHTIVRTDWTSSAVHTTFNGSSMVHWGADHQNRAAGHISIQRGSDYLLINNGQWQGADGVTGMPGSDNSASWNLNTLFLWDGGAICQPQTVSAGQYAGCQMFWSTENSANHKEASSYVFQEADLKPAYLNNPGKSSLVDYHRSFVDIGDIDFVFDRVSVPNATYTRNLYWHTPALISSSPPGNASAVSLKASIASVTVGSSTLWIKTLLPASPTITQSVGVDMFGSVTNIGTQEFIVSDTRAAGCIANCLFLTVLAPTSSGVESMPKTTLIDAAGYKGAIYDDGTMPRVALFSADGTAQSGVTYTVSYSSSVNGRHVVLDMVPGTYKVTKDSTLIYSSLKVGNDGSLSFMSTGGSTFAIHLSEPSQVLLPPTDLRVTVQ